MRWMTLFLLWAASTSVVVGLTDPNTIADSFGNATVERIYNIDEHGTLYCDLAGWPPIIGKNIPVKIKDLKPAASPEANRNIQTFLAALFNGTAEKKPHIMLVNIQRGQTFCLRADIKFNDIDVARLLIERGLAQRVLEVKEPINEIAPSGQPIQPLSTSPASASPPSKSGYVASKSSKIFHRSDCYHVRGMDTSKAVYFNTREEAIKTGRRPCKTCNP